MKKIDVIRKLGKEKVVVAIRTKNKDERIKMTEAVKKGAIKFLESTLSLLGTSEILREAEQFAAGICK